jgi:hypothetical protein
MWLPRQKGERDLIAYRAHWLRGEASSQFGSSRVSMVLALLLAVSLLFTGCSGSKDKQAAAEAVNKGLRRDALRLLVFIGRVSEKCAPLSLDDNQDLSTRPEYHAAQKAGLISITPDGPGFWKVDLVNPKPELVENLKKARHDVKDGCDDLYFGFVVASKTADIVSLHKVTDEKTEAEFTWKWKLEPAGIKLVDGLSQQERYQTTPYLEVVSRRGKRDPSFNLGNIDQSPQPGKMALKKSADGWVVDE